MAYFNQMSQTTKDTARQALRALVALVFIVAIVWVAMQSFRVLPSVRQFFANAFVSVQSFFSPAERIALSVVDSQVIIDKPFTLTWEHVGREHDGSYAMFYECRDDVHLARVAGSNESTLFCNTVIPLLPNETTLHLVAHGELDGVEEIPLSIRFSRNGTSVVSEEGTIGILVQDSRFTSGTSTIATSTDATDDNNGGGAASGGSGSSGGTGTTYRPGTPTYTTIPVTTQPQSDPNGKVDLAIRVVAIGLVDKDSGRFTEKDELPQDLPSGKRGAIKFVIENKGTKKTGDDWNFSAKLPTSPSYTYTSPSQDELYPGDKIEYVIGFDKIVNKDKATYELKVDPTNEVKESNEKNNTISRTIDIDRD